MNLVQKSLLFLLQKYIYKKEIPAYKYTQEEQKRQLNKSNRKESYEKDRVPYMGEMLLLILIVDLDPYHGRLPP